MQNMKRFDYNRPVYKPEFESFRGFDLYRQQLVVEALTRSPAIYDSHIEVVLKDNQVCIVGSVPTEQVKLAAEKVVADSLDGVKLLNELRVRSAEPLSAFA
jgi:hypothetical protein